VELPLSLAGVHDVFHVSQLKKYLKHSTNVVAEDTILLEPDWTYKVYLIKVPEQQDRVTHNKTTRFYKIQWNNLSKDEVTWEHEDYLQSNFLDFLPPR
jgi:poly(3-hydroxyalkanoate) synthetase